jgi:asparagine N-glycosylation enzyme membrane subunit Stt3
MKATSALSKLFEVSKNKILVSLSPLKILAQALSPLWVFGLALFFMTAGMYVLIDRN